MAYLDDHQRREFEAVRAQRMALDEARTRAALRNDSGLIPVEYFVVVEMDPPEERTAGGIILPTQVQEADKLKAQEATLVAVSPLAFTYEEWPEGARKPQVGDRILFKRHDGHFQEREIDGVKRIFKLLNDKSIIAIVEEPASAIRRAA